ncbi:MAG: hypothetical protein ABIL00_04085 [candidate division WOR-3 bacterium]
MKIFRWRMIFPFLLIIFFLLSLLFSLKKSKTAKKNFNLVVDSLNREIIFSGFLQKDTGWVQHLIYLEGYKWLKNNSAIVSSLRLKDFQVAFASLDFYLWDSLWQRTGGRKVDLFIEDIPAESLVLTDDKLNLGDFIFLGSPNFDHFALEGIYADCERCPIFDKEKEIFEKLFIRQSGRSGYYLNKKKFPKKQELKIMVKIK